jgi:DNA ligase-1
MKELFKRSTTGKISTWRIEVEGNKFRTISGFTDGKKVTSEWTVCESKSYCTDRQQALNQANALHTKKKDLGAFEDIRDIDTPVFFKPMLAHDFIKLKDKVKYPVMSQPKLDGVRAVVRESGMKSRNGKPHISTPHIHESLVKLFKEDPDLIFDGELYVHKGECDFNKIISLVRKKKPTLEDIAESKEHIKYHIYDLPSHPGTFEERMEALKELDLPECCVLTSTHLCKDEEEVMDYYSEYMADGYEGQMVRVIDSVYENKRSKSLMKHKVFYDQEFTIIDVLEGKGKLTGKVGRIIFEINGTRFKSAVNGDHEYLEQLFKDGNLIGKQATVKYFELTTDGIPRFPKVIAIRDFE